MFIGVVLGSSSAARSGVRIQSAPILECLALRHRGPGSFRSELGGDADLTPAINLRGQRAPEFGR